MTYTPGEVLDALRRALPEHDVRLTERGLVIFHLADDGFEVTCTPNEFGIEVEVALQVGGLAAATAFGGSSEVPVARILELVDELIREGFDEADYSDGPEWQAYLNARVAYDRSPLSAV